MLFFFLPLIFAYTVLALIMEQTNRPDPIWGLAPGQGILLLIVLSLLLGESKSKFLSQSGASLFPRSFPLQRILLCLMWSGLVYWEQMDIQLSQTFSEILLWMSLIPSSMLPDAAALSSGVLILVYWVSDAMSDHPLPLWNQQGLYLKLQETGRSMQRQSPLIALGIVQAAFLLLIAPVSPWLQSVGGMIPETFLGLLLVLFVSPWVILYSWGLRPLSSKNSEKIIQEELKANGVSVSKILAWPSALFSVSTAGVMGIIPMSRFLMISPQLLDVLSPEELRAVIAHEAGHLRHRHLPFFALTFFILIEFLMLGSISLEWMQWMLNWELPVGFTGFLAALTILSFLRFGIGFLSRNFERQADCNSLTRVGFAPFAQALMKVAWINGINPREKNWHHYGIQERIDFLSECDESPQVGTQQHQRVKQLKWGCVLLLAGFLAGNVFLSANTVQRAFLNYRMQHYASSWSKADIPLLGRVADSLYFDKKIQEAEHLYRKVLSLENQNIHALNNLAWLLAQKTEFSNDSAAEPSESLMLVKKAIQMEPESAYIWDTLAEGYFQTGNTEKAHTAALKALKLAQQGKGVSGTNGLSYYEERVLQFE